MKWTGRLEFRDLGPGVWVLNTDDGKELTLHGDIARTLDGAKVEVRGRHAGGFGFAMTGARAIEVSSVKKA